MISRATIVIAFAAALATPADAQKILYYPDLTVNVESDGTIAVRNIGEADVAAGFTIHVTCTVTAPTTRGQTCGAPFKEGQFVQTLNLPAGFKKAPIKLAPAQQMFIQYGPGWAMVYPPVPAWTKGSYALQATVDPEMKIQEMVETNNAASGTVTRN